MLSTEYEGIKFSKVSNAPVYMPTSKEFEDPIKYVAQIRPEAERYGIIKIIPPAEFNPPFCVDPENFHFSPRIQRLHEVDALAREKLFVKAQIARFWEFQGVKYRPLTINREVIDDYELYRAVVQGTDRRDGMEARWAKLQKKLKLDNKQFVHVQAHIEDYLMPYEKFFRDFVEQNEQIVIYDDPIDQEDRPKRSMQGFGTRRKRRPMKLEDDPSKQSPTMPRHLKCRRCNTYATVQNSIMPISHYPKGSWHCRKCVLVKMYEKGCGHGFYDSNTDFTLKQFSEYANEFKEKVFGKSLDQIGVGEVEKTFWECVLERENSFDIKYGADLITSKVGSGFPMKKDFDCVNDGKQEYINHDWNLNNMPVLPHSVFSNMDTRISGMMVPWVYVGMCYSTFCWHTEDHWTYSVNYNHWGEPKIWYGIPADYAKQFENVVAHIAPQTTALQKDVFHYMATAVNPAYLRAKGVQVYTVHQHAREFVITFPRAYHSGFNCGVNFAEAVNFAPYDWLPFGRESIINYVAVRRPCVFSFDELVMRTGSRLEKLGVATAHFLYDELEYLCYKHKKCEVMLEEKSKVKLRRRTPREVERPYEERVCRYCKIVLGLSIVRCKHNQTACMEHEGHVCASCIVDDLEYKLWSKETFEVTESVFKRMILQKQWLRKIKKTVFCGKKPPDPALLVPLDEQTSFSKDVAFKELTDQIALYHEYAEQAQSVLVPKMQTRRETRNQRADNRMGIKDMYELLENMVSARCSFGDMVPKLRTRCEQVSTWLANVRKLLKMLKTDLTNVHQILEPTIERGEAFDLRIPELEELRKYLRVMKWKIAAEKVLAWKCRINMEDDKAFLLKERHTMQDVPSFIKEGGELIKKHGLDTLLTSLETKYDTARKCDAFVGEFRLTENITMEKLELTWRRCRESDWCHSPNLDWIRKEYTIARFYCNDKNIDETSLVEISKHIEKFQKSSVISSTKPFKRRLAIKNSGDLFTRKMVELFMRPPTYHALSEILNERGDLVPLIEGRIVTLNVHEFTEPLKEWENLIHFDSFEDVQSHLLFLRRQRKTLLASLSKLNGTKAVEETCTCLSEKNEAFICCLLCNAKYHISCCRWDDFLDNLTNGAYLCVRCLRSSRPAVKDVEQVRQYAHEKSIEGELVRVLANIAKQNSVRIKNCAVSLIRSKNRPWPQESKDQAMDAIQDFLSIEVSEPSVYKELNLLLEFLYEPFLASQKESFEKFKLSVKPAKSPQVLFADRSRIRQLNDADVIARKKRKVVQYHEDKEVCSFKECLRPSVEQVGWVQCECCGCWYHLVCVGLTFEEVLTIDQYKCKAC